MILPCYAYNLYPYLLATMVKQQEWIVNEPPHAADRLIPFFPELVPDLFREGAKGFSGQRSVGHG